ncbi:sulfatase family protein [Planctomicrobium piriforme]|uniref:N-sulfoglucosamine sulfohydrolase n=1 Tax=Planctomicrobium piriforme TaxID=1576369 RepID=A0A1I3LXJ8_9PLAN|nr:sulfatase [Planctomicrobium piriforme]SFI89166.1 N-sulfoglucosamine sulfohydrolase [Planctomicrobium piriforme]
MLCFRLFCLCLFALQTQLLCAAERNIVFFITDDESPTLGCYGDHVAVSPNIDGLAKDGTLFKNAFATTASCSASRSVVMTGVHNHLNGQYGHEHAFHHFFSFADVISLSLPRALADAGYRTGHIGKMHVAPEEVYHFETYLKANERNTVAMAETCRDFISQQDDRPFFLYFAPSDPHRGPKEDDASSLELKPNLFGNQPGKKEFPGIQEVFFDPAKVPVPSFLPDTPECRAELAQYYQACARIDQGLGRLIEILKAAGVYEKTLIVFTSDHGIAMPGAKTTVYEPGLRVPFVVRNPYEEKRGVVSQAMISHVDITPSLLDFAVALDREKNRPKNWKNPEEYWKERGERQTENRAGGHKFNAYHGRSWLQILGAPDAAHNEAIYASHTFHEIQMYYPMRVIRDKKYKLIWNLADGLPFPFASDLWAAPTWQAQYRLGPNAPYGHRTVGEYIHRPRFELYDMEHDPEESVNLASDPHFASVLADYQKRLQDFQSKMQDPWISKWEYE